MQPAFVRVDTEISNTRIWLDLHHCEIKHLGICCGLELIPLHGTARIWFANYVAWVE